MNNKKTTLLCVLDGFGLNPDTKGNAVAQAHKPNFDTLWATETKTTLVSYGERVGLPAGQMGNSEVGHLNIGAGRVVEQWLLRISNELRAQSLSRQSVFEQFIRNIENSPRLHLIGLFSDGGVHSQVEHLKLLIERVAPRYTGKICLHIITDGRDTSPHKSLSELEKFSSHLSRFPSLSITTVCGRFYAMDRDTRWERVQRAYEAMVLGIGASAPSAKEWITQSHENKTTDEFIEPAVISDNKITPGDAAIFWNFREDRMREIVRALCVEQFDGFTRGPAPLSADKVLCFTEYDHSFHLPYLFAPLSIENHLGETVAKAGLKQLRVAETEKYPHVTYFLNGGIEKEYPGESRQMVPSPRDVKTYDLKPEMSAAGVTDIVVKAIEAGEYALIVVNIANCDMVGHTGVLEAAIKAVETADACLGRMITALRKVNGQAIIIADHGNADQMVHYVDDTPHTAHTTHPVPCILVGLDKTGCPRINGALCDVAPTVLKMMGIPQPAEMTGSALI